MSFSEEESLCCSILEVLLKKSHVFKPAHSSYITALVSVSYAHALLTESHIWQFLTDPQLAPFLLISIR